MAKELTHGPMAGNMSGSSKTTNLMAKELSHFPMDE